MGLDQLAQYRQSVRHGRHRPAPGAQTAIDEAMRQSLVPLPSQLAPEMGDAPSKPQPIPVFDVGPYDGDAQVIPFTTNANRDQLILPRPSGKRTLLVIQVITGATLQFSFGQGSLNGGLQIAAGGSAFFDTVVPQNDLYISSTGASRGIVMYVNISRTVSI